MSKSTIAPPVIIHGWTVYQHPLFQAQVDELARSVEALKRKNRATFAGKAPTQRLAAIVRLAFDVIPQDPTRAEYRQGNTLGDEYRHWFRAKFFQQYRLFFRYHLESRVLVYAWVNDENTLQAYESKSDVYMTFRRMLESGVPPNGWDELMASLQGDY